MVTKKDKFLAAAQKFLERGTLDKALAEFQRAAQEDAKDTRTWLRIAEIHVKRGESGQATQVYLKTADLYVEQGFFQRAVAVYKNVLKLTPGHTDAHFKLAEVYKQLGLFSDAAQQYDAAASALQRGGKVKEAMAALGQIVEMNPDQVMYRVKLAEVAAQAGLGDDAGREFARAAEQLEGQGRIDEYLRVAERLLSLQPENHALARRVAVRYMERQNPRAALAKLQTCFNADPKDPETLRLLADAFEQLGQNAKTISVLKELVAVWDERRMPGERNQTIHRILRLDPNDSISIQLQERTTATAVPSVKAFVEDRGSGLPASAAGGRRRREAAITFSELAIPPILAREPSLDLDLTPAPAALSADQVEAETQRIIAESDTFVKYGLVERAAEHLRKVFDLAPEHSGAQERLIAVLVQLGRKAEAVEELGILADRLMTVDPSAAERHLRRALEIDPNAAGARHLLDRLLRDNAALASAGEAEVEELELDAVEIDPSEPLTPEENAPLGEIADSPNLPVFGFSAPARPAAQNEEVDEWGAGSATQIDPRALAPAPAAEFATGNSTMALSDLDLELPGVPAALSGFEELEIDLESGAHGLPAAMAPPMTEEITPEVEMPLDPAAEAELEQIDFFLEQELPDEARGLLDELSPAFAAHPAIRDRRARLAELEKGKGEATRALPLPAALALSLGATTGAVPRGHVGSDRSRPPTRESSITPRAVVSSGGEDPATQRDLGIAYKEMGLFDAAIAELGKLVDKPGHEVFALAMMGECYEAKGAPAEALLHYKKALNHPQIREDEATGVYYQLGRVFHALGDGSEALYFFEKVARRDPEFEDVGQRVAELRAQGVAPMDRAGGMPDERQGAAGGNRGRR